MAQEKNNDQQRDCGTAKGGKVKADISIHGQESNYTIWRLAKMNLALRGIDAQIATPTMFSPTRLSTTATDAARDRRTTSAGFAGTPLVGSANFA